MHNRHITFVIATLLSIVGLAIPVYAEENQEQTEPQTASPSTLELTPVSQRLSLNAGEEKINTINLKNSGQEKLSLKLYSTPYSNGEDGESQDFDTQSTFTQISKWITIQNEEGNYVEEASLSINPGESKGITYKISVPENAPSGGQYATIMAEIVPENPDKEQIQTISRAAMTVFAAVAGETQRLASIGDINANSAAIGKNIGINFTVANKGNIDFQVSSEIRVSTLTGKDLYQNTSVYSILPESNRMIISEWNDTPHFGIFRLNYVIDALDIHAEGGLYVLSLTPLLLGILIVLVVLSSIAIFYLIKTRTIDKDADIVIG